MNKAKASKRRRKEAALKKAYNALRVEYLRRVVENEKLRHGAEEMQAMVMQIVMQNPLHYSNDDPLYQKQFQVFLPKTNVKDMVRRYKLVAENWDTGLYLRVDEREENDEH